MSIAGFIYFILVLGIIVLVHELGHLIVAKRNGVYCHEFSIGMGPKITKLYVDKTGTVYNLRWIPIGGYVQMAGEDTGFEADENINKDKKFDSKSIWVRFKILFSGALMNFILGIIVLFIVAFFGGVNDINTTKITSVENMPLYEAGVHTGDTIIEVDGKKVNSYEDITTIIEAVPKNVNIEYIDESTGKTQETNVKKNDVGKIGISPYKEQHNFLESIKSSFKLFIIAILEVFYSFYLLFTGGAQLSDLSGPVGIAVVSSGIFETGWVQAANWLAFLSINIGLINILPIPALDGGRILFLIIEKIKGKPLNRELETKINNIVFLLLLALFVFVTISDILKLDELLALFN